MSVDPTTALAMSGATTLVAAMATSAWEATRSAAGRMFRRRGQDQQAVIEAQLDGDADLVEQDEDAAGARRDLIGPWTRRLAALLSEHPETQAELRALIEEAHKELPAAQQSWVQCNTVENGGTIYALQGDGTLNVNQQPTATAAHPGPAEDHRE